MPFCSALVALEAFCSPLVDAMTSIFASVLVFWSASARPVSFRTPRSAPHRRLDSLLPRWRTTAATERQGGASAHARPNGRRARLVAAPPSHTPSSWPPGENEDGGRRAPLVFRSSSSGAMSFWIIDILVHSPVSPKRRPHPRYPHLPVLESSNTCPRPPASPSRLHPPLSASM
ncbi:hypothetical protein B0H13DRAFT_2352811 [Mycena leptocephala]|nr:hypothetical protein B0H13DRAFT_2352811 [Mycena leptocephala]